MEELLTLGPLVVVLFVVLWFLCSSLYPVYKQRKERNRELDSIEERYEALRRMRRDLIYHIDWAIDRGERSQAQKLEPELDRIDQELEELRNRFHAVQSGKNPNKL